MDNADDEDDDNADALADRDAIFDRDLATVNLRDVLGYEQLLLPYPLEHGHGAIADPENAAAKALIAGSGEVRKPARHLLFQARSSEWPI